MPVHWIAASTSNYSGRCLCICIYSDIHNALVIILPQREEPPRQHDAARQEKKKEEEEENSAEQNLEIEQSRAEQVSGR